MRLRTGVPALVVLGSLILSGCSLVGKPEPACRPLEVTELPMLGGIRGAWMDAERFVLADMHQSRLLVYSTSEGLVHIGNNLKQIARWANTFASEAEAVEVVAEGLSPPFNSWPAAADDAAGQPGGHRRRDSGDGAPRSLPRQRRGKLGVQRGAQRPLGQTAMFNIAWAEHVKPESRQEIV